MLYYPFDLTEYFIQTKKYYYFFDGLFILEKRLKKEILEELMIPDSTYRTNRLKVYTKNNNHIILLDYFKYNKINNPQSHYEKCLSKIFNAFYYRDLKELSILTMELEGYIKEHNYLMPIFIIFKLLIAITTTANYHILLKENKEYLDYLCLFPKEYFTSELHYIVSLILYYCERRVDVSLLKNYFPSFPDLAWLYYSVRGNYEYLHNNDYEAMVYYENSLQFFKNNLNFRRLVAVSNNIAYIHNVHEQYELSLQYLESILPHAFYQENNRIWIKYLTMHYLYSNFMLQRYSEIQKFLSIFTLKKEEIDPMSVILVILTAKKLNIKLEVFNSVFLEVVKENEEVYIFYNMVKKSAFQQDVRQFFLYSNNYFKKIIEILKLDID